MPEMVHLVLVHKKSDAQEKQYPVRVQTSRRLVFEKSHPATRVHDLVYRRFGRD